MTLYSISILAMILFSLGVIGVVARRNIFVIYMSIELILNSINLMLIAFARYQGNMDGQILAIMIIAIAAAEAAVFFSIIILLFRSKGSLDTDIFTSLKKEG
jgi:NADH-quinone oxidoreductase subunit K